MAAPTAMCLHYGFMAASSAKIGNVGGSSLPLKPIPAELLSKELRPNQVIYCSPLVDPYQPAEAEACVMPAILRAVADAPPRLFVLQTRGPLILRDLDLLRSIPGLRVGFSVTTDREEVRRRYEPHCEPNSERLSVVRELVRCGVRAHVVLAPLLPCDPENLARQALEASPHSLVADPLHVRAVKAQGATTREGALRIAQVQGEGKWLDRGGQEDVLNRIAEVAEAAGRSFGFGPQGFSLLSQL